MELSIDTLRRPLAAMALLAVLGPASAEHAPPDSASTGCAAADCRLFRNEILSQEVNRVGQALAAHAGRPDLRFRFRVVDTDLVDAWATADGEVRISLGALNSLRDETELASVLAHEIAHVTARGRPDGFGHVALHRTAGENREVEIDRAGVALLAGAGYRPMPLRELVPVLLTHSVTGAQRLFPSHPLWRPGAENPGRVEQPIFFFGS